MKRLYYFLDLFAPLWDFIKVYGTFHGQVKKMKIVNYLQRIEPDADVCNIQRLVLYSSLEAQHEEYRELYDKTLLPLKEIVNKGISIDCEKIIAHEIKKHRADNVATMYCLLLRELICVTKDDFDYLMYALNAGAEFIMYDINNREL